MNTVTFDKPKSIEELKTQYNIHKVSLVTSANLYPLVKGIEYDGNLSAILEKKREFPIKRKMDNAIEQYTIDMLKDWDKAKKKLLTLKNRIKDMKKMDYNNAQTIDRIGRIPFKYKKQFVEICDKYELNLALLDAIVLNPSLLVNARYDSRKNLMELNPKYLEQHGMIRIGDSGVTLSETSKTFIHEFGHCIWYNSLTEEDRRAWEGLSRFFTREQLTGEMSQYVVGEKKKFDDSTVYSPFYTLRNDLFVSVYARFNVREDWSECYLYYKVDPKTLARADQNKYAFLEEKIGARIEKTGTSEGAVKAWDTRGRSKKDIAEDYTKFKIGDKEVEVIKNPTRADYDYLNEQFREKYPKAGAGEPKTRIAYDSNGNHYVWGVDTMHEEVKNHFKNNLGIELGNPSIIQEKMLKGAPIGNRNAAKDGSDKEDHYPVKDFVSLVDKYSKSKKLIDANTSATINSLGLGGSDLTFAAKSTSTEMGQFLAEKPELINLVPKEEVPFLMQILEQNNSIAFKRVNAIKTEKLLKQDETDVEEYSPDIQEPHIVRDSIIATLYGLKDNLSVKAKEHISNAYNLGRQKGVYYTGAAFLTAMQQADKDRVQEILDRNDKFLDGFMDDMVDEYDDVLFTKTPAGMIEAEKTYDDIDEFDSEFSDVMATKEHRLGLYAVNGLSLGLMAGMMMETEDQFAGGVWHTSEDDRVCDGCDKLDGMWMSYDEYDTLYGNNECDGNCRCGELFEPTLAPGDSMEMMAKGAPMNNRNAAKDYSGENKDIFNPNTTNVSHYDNLFGTRGNEKDNVKGITQKEYYAKHKGVKGEVVQMSPDEYLSKIPHQEPSKDSAEKIKGAIASGSKLPIPYLDYSEGRLSQEGRNRSYVARELGIKKIPVLVVNKL